MDFLAFFMRFRADPKISLVKPDIFSKHLTGRAGAKRGHSGIRLPVDSSCHFAQEFIFKGKPAELAPNKVTVAFGSSLGKSGHFVLNFIGDASVKSHVRR